ncbi:MAG: YARHG domain-containing protein [Aliishimia sp.]
MITARGILTTLVLLCAGPALARDYCDEMWFTRNLIFDKAGYCFGSALGQAVFDNTDCTTKAPNLTADEKRAISDIKSEETRVECKINSKTIRALDIPNIDFRKSVHPIPIPDAHGFGCFGWKGVPFSLYRGTDTSGPAVAQVLAGDDIFFFHWSKTNWVFLTIKRDETEFQGWAKPLPTNETTCTKMAG